MYTLYINIIHLLTLNLKTASSPLLPYTICHFSLQHPCNNKVLRLFLLVPCTKKHNK